MSKPDPTEVLTIRVSRDVSRRLTQEARRQRRPRSAVARAILAEGLGEGPGGFARRSSPSVTPGTSPSFGARGDPVHY
jgi:hypothetical protein